MAKILALRAAGKDDEAAAYLKDWSQIIGSGTAGVGAERNDISRKRLQINTWKDIRDNAENEDERKEASRNILLITKEIAKLEEGGDSGPAVGTVDSGYRFKGGNPSDKNNWEKVK